MWHHGFHQDTLHYTWINCGSDHRDHRNPVRVHFQNRPEDSESVRTHALSRECSKYIRHGCARFFNFFVVGIVSEHSLK